MTAVHFVIKILKLYNMFIVKRKKNPLWNTLSASLDEKFSKRVGFNICSLILVITL